MNRSNVAQMYRSARERMNGVATKAAVGATALVPGFAFASGGSGFDASEITGKISENATLAVGILGAFALAVWSLRAMGLLKRG